MVTILFPVMILVVLALAAVVGGVLRSGSTDTPSSRLVLRAYLHFASAATTLVVAVGAGWAGARDLLNLLLVWHRGR